MSVYDWLIYYLISVKISYFASFANGYIVGVNNY